MKFNLVITFYHSHDQNDFLFVDVSQVSLSDKNIRIYAYFPLYLRYNLYKIILLPGINNAVFVQHLLQYITIVSTTCAWYVPWYFETIVQPCHTMINNNWSRSRWSSMYKYPLFCSHPMFQYIIQLYYFVKLYHKTRRR